MKKMHLNFSRRCALMGGPFFLLQREFPGAIATQPLEGLTQYITSSELSGLSNRPVSSSQTGAPSFNWLLCSLAVVRSSP